MPFLVALARIQRRLHNWDEPVQVIIIIILEDQTTFTYKDNPYGENALRRFFEWSWQTDGH